jgi:hypothetical protein
VLCVSITGYDGVVLKGELEGALKPKSEMEERAISRDGVEKLPLNVNFLEDVIAEVHSSPLPPYALCILIYCPGSFVTSLSNSSIVIELIVICCCG